MKRLLGKSSTGLFASRTLTGHLIRGGLAVTLVWFAIGHQQTHPAFAILAGVLALVVMRGCPVCWSIGLTETLHQRVMKRPGGQKGDDTRRGDAL